MKCLQKDNGGEYICREFIAYYTDHGIQHEKMIAHTPQHNGVAERMNQTIIERTRCMLNMAKLPKPFWGEVVHTSCYLINISPSVLLKFEVPGKVWFGRDVSYSQLRVFGYKAFAHVSKDLRLKLEYRYEEFRYKLWDPMTKNCQK